MSEISVFSDFEHLCKELRMNDTTVNNIRNRYHAITKRINLEYWGKTSETEHSLYVGSYGRGTCIYTSDIDIVVELPWTEYSRFNNYSGNGQSALLSDLRKCLLKTYSSSKIPYSYLNLRNSNQRTLAHHKDYHHETPERN